MLFERSNKLIFQDDGIEKRNENLVNPANDIEKRNIYNTKIVLLDPVLKIFLLYYFLCRKYYTTRKHNVFGGNVIFLEV